MKELRMILRKEFIHIIRDRITLMLVLAMPVALVLLFGFTISTDIHNARIAVLDHSKDSQSQAFVRKLSSSNYFQVVSYPNTETEIDFQFKENNIKLAIVIPQNFENQLENEHNAVIQVIDDVSDLNIASILNNYVRAVVQEFQNEYNKNTSMGEPFSITTKMMYNANMESVYMFVPGIITLIMILVTALMSSITLAREKETGTMRMLFITPVKKVYVVIGKVIPYMIISFISTIVIIIISVFVFKMPLNGSILFLLLLCIIFMLTAASFGMLISTISTTQLDAMMITMMGLFLPTVLLSGFLFPLNSMPMIFQILANVFPAKWFILAIKDVMIKGSGFFDVWEYLTILFAMAVIFISISLKMLDKRN
ncbi:MAG: ABC transporter permease [Bacteroidales bacterium]|nr:ABC transporter permease [Bacteroidales bacterium]